MKRQALGWRCIGCMAACALLAGQIAFGQRTNDQRSRAENTKTSSHSGTFGRAGKTKFFMTINGKNRHSHQITQQTKVTLNGRPATLQDLKPGDPIRVTVNDKNVALTIEATRREDDRVGRNQPRTFRQPDDGAAERDTPQARVFLGVRIQRSPTTGVYVADVMPGSPAAQAGIQRGEYILSIDGRTLSSPEEFRARMRGIAPSDSAKLVVWRGGRRRTLTVAFPGRQTAGYRGNPAAAGGQDKSQRKNVAVAWLGIRVMPTENSEPGVRVAGTYPSGPAARAGLQPGDRLIQIGQKKVNSPKQVASLIRGLQPGAKTELIVVRGDEQHKLTATLADRNDFFDETSARPPARSSDGSQGDYALSNRGVPEHSMMLEQHRRFAEQHQRIEKLILELQDEIQALRKDVQELKNRKSRD